jgi:putative glutamine amidotransferase
MASYRGQAQRIRRDADRAADRGHRVLVGVPAQTLQAIDGIPEGLPDSWVMSTRYMTALARAGAVPVMVPLLDDEATVRGVYDRLDGVFLAGGVDVHPSAYGQPPGPHLGRTDAARDKVELALARWAVADGKPLLGVCRGLHVLNVALGGTLYQDVAAELPGSIKHDYFPGQGYARDHVAHEIDVAAGSRLAGAFGAGACAVNSMHHQGIRDLGRGMRPSALAPDGLIEAVESGDTAYCVAVQWHPEALVEDHPGTNALFDGFADACLEWCGRDVDGPILRAFPDQSRPDRA